MNTEQMKDYGETLIYGFIRTLVMLLVFKIGSNGMRKLLEKLKDKAKPEIVTAIVGVLSQLAPGIIKWKGRGPLQHLLSAALEALPLVAWSQFIKQLTLDEQGQTKQTQMAQMINNNLSTNLSGVETDDGWADTGYETSAYDPMMDDSYLESANGGGFDSASLMGAPASGSSASFNSSSLLAA